MQIIYEHSNQFSMPLADSNLFALVSHNWQIWLVLLFSTISLPKTKKLLSQKQSKTRSIIEVQI